jgi:hypothetical protein
VIIVDEANELMSWQESDPTEVRNLLSSLVVVSKQQQQCHVVLATSDYGFKDWLTEGRSRVVCGHVCLCVCMCLCSGACLWVGGWGRAPPRVPPPPPPPPRPPPGGPPPPPPGGACALQRAAEMQQSSRVARSMSVACACPADAPHPLALQPSVATTGMLQSSATLWKTMHASSCSGSCRRTDRAAHWMTQHGQRCTRCGFVETSACLLASLSASCCPPHDCALLL